MMVERTRAWGLWLSLGMGMGAGACFNPPSDTMLTTGGLGCPVRTFECPCDVGGACEAGLVCEGGTCVAAEPTGTSGATGVVGTTGPEETSADVTGGSTEADGTTLALDGTSTGEESTGLASTGEASTGEASTGPGESTGMPEPVMQTVSFPTAADPRVIMFGTLPWNGGDYFEGVRDTLVPSVTQLDVHIPIVMNGLTDCGFQEAEVSLDGVPLGTFVVAQGTAVIDQSFAVPGVVGPQYTLRYETIATVASGCGAAGYDEASSTVTLWE